MELAGDHLSHRLYEDMKTHLYWAGRKNYDVITEYDFYHKLPPNLQTELIDQLFKKFLTLHARSFEGCERAFVNRIVVSLRYKSFEHNKMILQGKFLAREAYFLTKGSVAVCESTCFKEPIMVYRPGTFLLFYQALLEDSIDFDYLAVAD